MEDRYAPADGSGLSYASADASITGLTLPDSVAPGDTFNVEGTVDLAAGYGGGTDSRVIATVGTTGNVVDKDTVTTGTIPTGGSEGFRATLTAPTSTGDYTVWVRYEETYGYGNWPTVAQTQAPITVQTSGGGGGGTECHQAGGTCSSDADCCSGLVCVNGTCQQSTGGGGGNGGGNDGDQPASTIDLPIVGPVKRETAALAALGGGIGLLLVSRGSGDGVRRTLSRRSRKK